MSTSAIVCVILLRPWMVLGNKCNFALVPLLNQDTHSVSFERPIKNNILNFVSVYNIGIQKFLHNGISDINFIECIPHCPLI